MVKNRHLARSVDDASFGELRRQITYKTSWNGRRLGRHSPPRIGHRRGRFATTGTACAMTGVGIGPLGEVSWASSLDRSYTLRC